MHDHYVKERQAQLDLSSPYVPGLFAPGSFSVVQRDRYHFDVYAQRRPGYVQYFYEKNPTSISYPMAEGLDERAFAIRGEPGDIYVRDERWDIDKNRSRAAHRFESVKQAMTWISSLMLDPVETHHA